MRKSSIIILLMLIALAVGIQAQRSKSVLLPASEAKDLAHQCSRDSPDDYTDTWGPTAEDIKKMESRFAQISSLKAKKCCMEGDSIEDPASWYMQYVGLVWKGKKVIYISAISTRKPEGACYNEKHEITDESCELWKQHAYIICDGGTNWGVIYDVNSGKFSDLAVNGVG